MIHFEHVQSHSDLQGYYGIIEEACARITVRSGTRAFAPDVYSAILHGKAELVVGFRDGELKGFFTCYKVEHPCSPSHMHVWHGYIRPGDPPDGLVAAFAELERLAKSKGCSQLVFGTQRRGWIRAAKKVNMVLRDYTFAKNI